MSEQISRRAHEFLKKFDEFMGDNHHIRDFDEETFDELIELRSQLASRAPSPQPDARLSELERENTILRGMVAKQMPCHYCGVDDV